MSIKAKQQLDKMVSILGVQEVMKLLAEVVGERSDRIEKDYQDSQLSRKWRYYAEEIAKTGNRIS